jgi:hypothetical protein
MLTLMLLQGTEGLNTYYGIRAGENNTTGSSNTFIGAVAGSNNDTGYQNTFVGTDAGRANEGGNNNIFQGVSYEWKMDEYPDFGLTEGKQIDLIAQDVEKELPELVSEDKDGYKAVSYTKLTAVLVEAVKVLKAQSENNRPKLNDCVT